jgi:hypothetical protein
MSSGAEPLLVTSRHQVELEGRVPVSATPGAWVPCEWGITNLGVTEIRVNFYLRSTPAPLAALVCLVGAARNGRFHGSATIVIRKRETAIVSALLQPREIGEYTVSAAAVTRNETVERTDVVAVYGAKNDSGNLGVPAPLAERTPRPVIGIAKH